MYEEIPLLFMVIINRIRKYSIVNVETEEIGLE